LKKLTNLKVKEIERKYCRGSFELKYIGIEIKNCVIFTDTSLCRKVTLESLSTRLIWNKVKSHGTTLIDNYHV